MRGQVWRELREYFGLKNIEESVRLNIENFIITSEGRDRKFALTISNYIKNAANGNLKGRQMIKDYIRTILLTDIKIYSEGKVIWSGSLDADENRGIADEILPFNEPVKLSCTDKFEIILYGYKDINDLGYDKAFNRLKARYPCFEKDVFHDNKKVYEYTSGDIEAIYAEEEGKLDFYEKIDVIVQRVYEDLYGLKCIDILAYSDINEVGISNNGRYVYVWSDEKIRLSFMDITEDETRIIQERSISFDDKVGALNNSNSEVLCYRADNARITAIQPPYSSARALCIRIFNKQNNTFKDIVPDYNQRLLIEALIRAGQKISLQGGLGTGKTTAMQVMLEVIPDNMHIGTVEDYFEQHNMLKYPDKRVVELQECMGQNKSLLHAVMSLFRLSVDVANVGEARDGNAIFSFIQLAQAISSSALFTSHVASPEDTVPRYKNMLIATDKYTSEISAISDIVNYINIIFQHEIIDNERRITKIVEIIPQNMNVKNIDVSMKTDDKTLNKLALIQQIQQNPAYMYRLNPLMVFDGSAYRFVGRPSERILEKAKKDPGVKALFDKLNNAIDVDLNSKQELIER